MSRFPLRLALALAALLPSCSAPASLVGPYAGEPYTSGEFDFSVGATAFPGVGPSVTFAQRMWETRDVGWSFEVELGHQFLTDSEGTIDGVPFEGDWDQVKGGVKLVFPRPDGCRWVVRTGVAWLRSQGDPIVFDEPGDFGSFYSGIAWERFWSRRVSGGPELVLYPALGEGSDGFGLVPQLTWRFTWHF